MYEEASDEHVPGGHTHVPLVGGVVPATETWGHIAVAAVLHTTYSNVRFITFGHRFFALNPLILHKFA